MKKNHCPPCTPTAFARNNYFTGKMLMERDFTDEQTFHAGKLLFHQKHLHGRGVACGLKVGPHPNPACRDRVVVIEPGAAFDCCGRTIAVPDKVCFTFADDPAVAELPKDGKPHTLQFCVRYRECETEPVPVLFDDCGDGSRCEANRVIESFEFGVKVDPPPPKGDTTAPKFDWENTLNAASAAAVVLHEDSRRIYILTAGDDGTVFPVNADNRDFLTPLKFGGKGVALAVSQDGTALVVAALVTTAGTTELKLRAFDTSDLTKPPAELALPPGADGIELAVAPDGRLFGLVHDPSGGGTMSVLSWGSLVLSPPPGADTVIPSVPAAATQPVFSTGGKFLYLVDASAKSVVSYDLKGATPPTATTETLPTGAAARRIALAHDTAGDTLVVADVSGTKVHFRAPDGKWSSANVPHDPLALVASPGGAWVYVLESDATDSFVRAVSVRRAQLGLSQPDVVAKVGKQSQQLVLSSSGTTLFVPFLGDPAVPDGTDGGVAVLDVKEKDCGELLWSGLDGCVHCDEPDCIVLATVANYHVGDKLDDTTIDQPNVAHIDNRTGRVLLPSTQVLTEVIQCMLANCGGGGGGKQGPVGPTGPAGAGVKSADAESVPWTDDADADFDPVTGNIHFKIPKGEPGKDGDPGTGPTPVKLTGICGTNWRHADKHSTAEVAKLSSVGLLVAFNGTVRAGDINRHSFAVLAKRQEESDAGPLECWCELLPKDVRAVRLKPSGGACPQLERQDGPLPGSNEFVNGAWFFPPEGFRAGQEYRVIMKGDLIRADAGDGILRSLDGNHLYPWVSGVAGLLPVLPRPSGDGIEGGTFESWFTTQ